MSSEIWVVATLIAPLIIIALAFYRRTRWRVPALLPWSALPALVLSALGDEVRLDFTGLFGMRLGFDASARPLLLALALAWSLIGVHARADLLVDIARVRFMTFCAAAMFGSFGVVLARHVEAFHFFFAVMVYAGYGLVVHTGSARARHAARIYLVVAVIADTLLVAGLLLLAGKVGSEHLEAVPAAFLGPGSDAAFVLLLVALGARAGLLSLHVPLLLAARVAPLSASAVVFGPMVAVTLFGWSKFLPLGAGSVHGGILLASAGAATAAWGWLRGLSARDPRLLLAYAGMGQTGYALCIFGLALHAGDRNIAFDLFPGSHALVMAALFFVPGLAPADWSRSAVSKALATAFAAEVFLLAVTPWPLPLIASVAAALLMARFASSLPVSSPPAAREGRRLAIAWTSTAISVLFIAGAFAYSRRWWALPVPLVAVIAALLVARRIGREPFNPRPVLAFKVARALRRAWRDVKLARGTLAGKARGRLDTRAARLVSRVSAAGAVADQMEIALRRLGVAGLLLVLLVLTLFVLLAA